MLEYKMYLIGMMRTDSGYLYCFPKDENCWIVVWHYRNLRWKKKKQNTKTNLGIKTIPLSNEQTKTKYRNKTKKPRQIIKQK